MGCELCAGVNGLLVSCDIFFLFYFSVYRLRKLLSLLEISFNCSIAWFVFGVDVVGSIARQR